MSEDWFLYWVLTPAAFLYLFYDHADTWAEFKAAKGRRAKLNAGFKLFLLWLLAMGAAYASWRSVVSGEEMGEKVNTHGAEIGKINEAARHRALELPRLDEMLKELEGAPKLQVQIHFPIGDAEAEQLAHQIGGLLQRAKIAFRGGPMVDSRAPRGVTVNHGADTASSRLATAITKAISKGGVTATASPEAGSDGQVSISIGRKP